ncbi:hypothetical protein ACJX0J_036003, partial [Zea mays]
TSKAHSWTCIDLYVFATPYRVTWDYYFLGREHTLDIKEWESEAEYEYVKRNGVSIFLMPSGTIGTLRALWDVFPLFTNTAWGENANLAFLEKHMGATFEERPKPWVSELNPDDIQSGDFLVLSKIRGRWGGFETLEKWVTGAYAGHTAVCLRDSDGKLWVGESGNENEQGEDVIAILPWEEWWEFEVTKDDSNPQIALLPLHPDLRAKFNETAAWIYAKSMEGKPYGYHNMIFSWIDTISDNYPPPLDAHVVASVMTVWSKLQPEYAANMWKEALNKRLGTKGLDLSEIIVESEKRGITFDKLLSSASCVAFAGLFDPITSSIEAYTEAIGGPLLQLIIVLWGKKCIMIWICSIRLVAIWNGFNSSHPHYNDHFSLAKKDIGYQMIEEVTLNIKSPIEYVPQAVRYEGDIGWMGLSVVQGKNIIVHLFFFFIHLYASSLFCCLYYTDALIDVMHETLDNISFFFYDIHISLPFSI